MKISATLMGVTALFATTTFAFHGDTNIPWSISFYNDNGCNGAASTFNGTSIFDCSLPTKTGPAHSFRLNMNITKDCKINLYTNHTGNGECIESSDCKCLARDISLRLTGADGGNNLPPGLCGGALLSKPIASFDVTGCGLA